MIKSIHVSAHFSTSGATLSADFQPSEGLTAVVGENGAGKTFVTIEAARWLLFGKAALRGAAADYKNAEARGVFAIRGADYEISRGKHEWIKHGTETLARGAEKVTEKVVELLGYGLDVFDLCNAATQGNLQRLGNMRPAERKAIIDQVLRLTDAEKAEKDCREEAKGYRREAEALAKTLRAPGDEPPSISLQTIRDLKTAVVDARDKRRRLEQLQAQRRDVEAPIRPVVDAFSEDAIAELEVYVDEQRELQRRHQELTKTAAAFDYTAEQLDKAQHRLKKRLEINARGPQPDITKETMEKGFSEHRAYSTYTASELVTCPKCDHIFRTTGEAPPLPKLPMPQLLEAEARWRAWDGHDFTEALPEGLDLTEAVIQRARLALAAREELATLEPVGPERQTLLNRMRQDKAALEAYTAALLQFDRIGASNTEVDRQIAALGPVLPQVEIDVLADEANDAARAWDARLAWEREDQIFKETQAKIVEANRLAEEFKLGAQGITDARATIKALIAPKISRIATALIRDMTMNKLDNLVVDDEMEITVGGQRLETLSGAGKTVANLALRIAMGQALVGHVFPVFLADEIDGDLSTKRREATLQALVSLKKHLSQIILVTHRGAEIADHTYRVSSPV